nr:response regulator [Bacteroidota bacterium]
ANYLLALINDVLNISKIESYNLEDEQEVFNLHELLESIISSFEYMRLQNNNSISVDISKGIPFWLKGNPVQLSQVLMNLVGNACKFTENGSIVIEALEVNNTDTQTDITFSVKDTGIGISKEKHIAIFEEFSQVENNNYTYQGTGLGLPIVKKLLARSNSEIELKSELGKGSEFTFTLSFIPTEKEPLPKELAIMDPILLKNKKILIAEDNRINQIVTKKILENNGMTCVIATNGKEAVLEMKNQKFDLILMDLNMPVMDGFEASRQIRLNHTKIPIVALTAVEVEEVRNKIYIAGMNDIIVKPYDINKFLQTILKNILIEASKVSISTNKKVV